MKAIEQINEKLKEYPDVKTELESKTISATPKDGFTVWLSEYEEYWIVGCHGWHEHFEDKKQALNCFEFCLSSKCRLKTFKRGNTEYKWILETLEDDEWITLDTVGLVFFPFWRKVHISYSQNNIQLFN